MVDLIMQVYLSLASFPAQMKVCLRLNTQNPPKMALIEFFLLYFMEQRRMGGEWVRGCGVRENVLNKLHMLGNVCA